MHMKLMPFHKFITKHDHHFRYKIKEANYNVAGRIYYLLIC